MTIENMLDITDEYEKRDQRLSAAYCGRDIEIMTEYELRALCYVLIRAEIDRFTALTNISLKAT